MGWTLQQMLDATPLQLQQYKNGLTPGTPDYIAVQAHQDWRLDATNKTQTNTNRLKNGFNGATGLDTPPPPPTP